VAEKTKLLNEKKAMLKDIEDRLAKLEEEYKMMVEKKDRL
jgi:dynein heavy chain, axonemal